MTCPQAIRALEKLVEIQNQMYETLKLSKPGISEYGIDDGGWTWEKVGNDYNWQQQFTLTGAAQNLDLIIPFNCTINRIEYFSDDTTAKSFTTRIFSGRVDTSSYAQLVNLTADTTQSNQWVPIGEEGKYIQAPIRFRTAVSASTLNKKLTVKITVRRL